MTALALLLNALQDTGRVAPGYERNFEYLFYGLLVTWLILFGYVIWISMRERRIKQELERLRAMVADPDKGA